MSSLVAQLRTLIATRPGILAGIPADSAPAFVPDSAPPADGVPDFSALEATANTVGDSDIESESGSDSESDIESGSGGESGRDSRKGKRPKP